MKRLLFALPLLFGCSSGDDFEATCDVNQTRACACPGGEMGAQTCLADRSGWGKCECTTDGDAGKGGGGGLGAGGASDKECSVDDDCSTADKPFCVKFKCIAPVAVDPGGDCGERYQQCPPDFTCDDFDGGKVCVAPKAR